MGDALYLYCIFEGDGKVGGTPGLLGGAVTTVPFKDIAAVVSSVPYQELESNISNIMAHEKVVEAARAAATTMPVRFGVIFRTKDGVRRLLSESYQEYKKKLSKLEGKDEYGVKLILGPGGLKDAGNGADGKRAKTKEPEGARKGTSYIMKLKAEEAQKVESLKKLDELSQRVDEELGRAAADSARLKSESDKIVLNAAYLVERTKVAEFRSAAERLAKEVANQGFDVHVSGPWAPYSFC